MIDEQVHRFHESLTGVYGHLGQDIVDFALRVSEAIVKELVPLVEARDKGPLLASMRAALDGYEAITQEGERSGVFLDDYDCREGCGHCCCVKVVCSPLEALVVAEHVRATRPNEGRAQLERALGVLLQATRGVRWDERAELPCPFLLDGACEIYEVRPFVCRGYISLNVQDCLAPRPNFISFDEDRQMLAEVFSHATMLACQVAGLETDMVDFHEALEFFSGGSDPVTAWLEGHARVPVVRAVNKTG